MNRKKLYLGLIITSIIIGGLFVLQNYRMAKAAPVSSLKSRVSAPPKNGLVGWWTMDTNDMSPTGATTYDKSGQNNHGTVTGTTTSTGKIGQARSFSGAVSDIVSITDPASGVLDFGTGNFSVAWWAKPTNTGATNLMIGKYPSNATEGAFDFSVRSTGSVDFLIRNNTTNGTFSRVVDPAGLTYRVDDAKWHHFTATRVDSLLTVYVDGVSVGTNSGLVSGANISNSNNFVIGGRRQGEPFTGSIDDVRIYNRVLSAQEVANLYSAAKINYISAPPRNGLVGWWTMDTNDMSPTGAKMVDKSGFNNNGTVTGTTTSTGKIGQSRTFNGTGNFINMGDRLDMGDHSFTLSTWIKYSTSIANYPRIVSKEVSTGAGAGFGYGLGIDDTALYKVPCIIIDQDTSTFYRYGTTKINDNKWHHIVGIADASDDSLKLYMDGKLENGIYSSGSWTGAGNSSNFNIGTAARAPASYYFLGSIDDVRIYNYALSANEVANLYQSAKSQFIK